jgi:hypothetical protein
MNPFELANGQQPIMPHDVAAGQTYIKCPAAYRFARSKQEMIDEAKDSLTLAQQRMKHYADLKQRDMEFKVRDFMMLQLSLQIWKKINSKTVHHGLIPKYDEPFEVIKKVRRVAYRLKLLNWLKVHPTFHVSFLKPFDQDELVEGRNKSRCAPPPWLGNSLRKMFTRCWIIKLRDKARRIERLPT